MKPQKYHSVDPANLDRYLDDDRWVAEQKLDGVRCVVSVDDGEVVLTSNSGRRMWPNRTQLAWWPELLAEFDWLADGAVLDGELFHDGHIWLFDCPIMPGFVTPASAFSDRRRVLDHVGLLLPGRRAHVVAQYAGAAKQGLWEAVVAGGAEGIVLKDLDGPYRADGGRTYSVLKVKRTYTVDVIVLEVGVDGKDSSAVGLYRDGVIVPVGKVTMSRDDAKPGDVLEVRFLYVDDLDDPKLYQSVFIRTRPDKEPHECEFDQLLHTVADRSVVAA